MVSVDVFLHQSVEVDGSAAALDLDVSDLVMGILFSKIRLEGPKIVAGGDVL